MLFLIYFFLIFNGMAKINVAFNPEKGEIFFHGIGCRMNLRYGESFVQREYERIVGPAARNIIFGGVKRANKNFFYSLLQREGKRANEQETVDYLLSLLSQMGCGLLTIEKWDLEEDSFLIEVENCYNLICYDDEGHPVCYEMAAKIAAVFEAVFERKVEVEETSCAIMEPDSCKFEVLLKEEEAQFRKPYSIKEESEEHEMIELEYDPDRGEIFYEGDNSSLIPREERNEIKNSFVQITGREMHYNLHYDVGKISAEDVITSLTGNMKNAIGIRLLNIVSKKKTLEEAMKQLPHRGFGKPKVIEADESKPEFHVRVKNSIEADEYKKKKKTSQRPVCLVLAGILAGGSGVLFDENMKCKEVKCVGLGDPHCEFIVYPAGEKQEEEE